MPARVRVGIAGVVGGVADRHGADKTDAQHQEQPEEDGKHGGQGAGGAAVRRKVGPSSSSSGYAASPLTNAAMSAETESAAAFTGSAARCA